MRALTRRVLDLEAHRRVRSEPLVIALQYVDLDGSIASTLLIRHGGPPHARQVEESTDGGQTWRNAGR